MTIMRLVITLVFVFSIPTALADLSFGFYNSTCPKAEAIIKSVVAKHFNADRNTTAGLLRVFFHDCLVRGCDASVLIEPTNNTPTERSAGPNLTLRPLVFTLINEAKQQLEKQCPNTVSCADIIAVATRDAVGFAGGPKYSVDTGRLDSLVSNINDVNLPGPSLSIKDAFSFFKPINFNHQEMTALVGGGHSVGTAHCTFFRNRLSNFDGKGKPDKTMHKNLRAKLISVCGSNSPPLDQDQTAFLDQQTSSTVDNKLFNMITLHRGVLQIDQEFALDNSTASFVNAYAANNTVFKTDFANALLKLGRLVTKNGNIRKMCTAFN